MSQENIGIILQARLGSTRLPGKILMPIAGKPLLECVLLRLKALRQAARLVIATTDRPQDDAVEAFCRDQGVDCFRGDEQNVLKRYADCARRFAFAHIVRLTGDNPFPDVEELDRLITLHLATKSDFSHSFSALPDGVGAEIFTLEALSESAEKSTRPHHFEHVDEYLLEHPERFKTSLLDVATVKKRPEIRLTVDTAEDYRRACFIAERAGILAGTAEAIALAERYATLAT